MTVDPIQKSGQVDQPVAHFDELEIQQLLPGGHASRFVPDQGLVNAEPAGCKIGVGSQFVRGAGFAGGVRGFLLVKS